VHGSQVEPLPESYKLHSTPPNWGGTLSQGTQNSAPSPLSPQRNFNPPNWNTVWSTRNQWS